MQNNNRVILKAVPFSLLLLVVVPPLASSSNTLPNEAPPKTYPHLGSSALVDGETGQVYWVRGRSTQVEGLFSSLPPHFRATVLTGTIVAVLFFDIFGPALKHIVGLILHSLLSLLYSVLQRCRLKAMRPLPPATTPTNKMPSLGLLFSSVTLHPTLLIPLYLIYILESANSSTIKYLSNTCSTSAATGIIDALRRTPPEVIWRIRTYHYEDRYGNSRKTAFGYDDDDHLNSLASSGGSKKNPLRGKAMRKKVYGSTKEERFVFDGWKDGTNMIASVDRRAKVGAKKIKKISLTKLLVFGSGESREQYRRQLSGFISKEGVGDDHYDFETQIRIGRGVWRDKLLVLLPSGGGSMQDIDGADEEYGGKRKALFMPGRISRFWYWIATIFLLTVPYRRWFARQCDEMTVQIVKETFERSDGLDASLNGPGYINSMQPSTQTQASSVFASFFPRTKFFRVATEVEQQKENEEKERMNSFVRQLKEEFGDWETNADASPTGIAGADSSEDVNVDVDSKGAEVAASADASVTGTTSVGGDSSEGNASADVSAEASDDVSADASDDASADAGVDAGVDASGIVNSNENANMNDSEENNINESR